MLSKKGAPSAERFSAAGWSPFGFLRTKAVITKTSRGQPWRKAVFPMNVNEQIERCIAGQPEPKRGDMQALHRLILRVMPKSKLWFLDGKNDQGKIVSNPNIGYGLQTIKYADGTSREFYQIGISPNTTGISVYLMGLGDKKFLANTYGKKLGKATVTGYCIKFKTLKDVNLEILEAAIRHGAKITSET